jgi:anaerobic magnesium-protoporphyrin IX monomethyl ester cyclase
MNRPKIPLIAFEEFDNLGVRYIASALIDAGYEVEIIDFRDGENEILKKLKRIKPLIVGFSIIFQYHIEEFEILIHFLRDNGINCHFTAGGQYPSLKYKDLFHAIPSMHSIVRFEGEFTFRELVNCIYNGIDWKKIPGIAYKSFNKIIENQLRPLELDLDNYPYPVRSNLRDYSFLKKYATILAGRGCIYNCIFCSEREYYKQSAGPFKRIREPKMVAEEMELLYNEKDCSIYLFQDDDFPVKTPNGSEWIKKFCREIKRRNLAHKIMWKINCRPDEINYDIFSIMKKCGLYSVFLGIENGTNTGLMQMNKHMTISSTLQGIKILKDLEISFEYGFMPFHPYSDYNSIKENFKFLREISCDGFTSATFLKMMPFSSTAIEIKLRKEGRLKGKPGFLDYDFNDVSLNRYYEFITEIFMEWLRVRDGLLHISKWARNSIAVFSCYNECPRELHDLKTELKKIVSESNNFFLDILEELAIIFESTKHNKINIKVLSNYREKVKTKHEIYKKNIKKVISRLLILDEFQRQTRYMLY